MPGFPNRGSSAKKSNVPRSPTINRPVALISLLMKTKLRLILHQLRPLVSSTLDLLQFAYQPGIRVDNGVIYLLHRYLSHLEQVGSTVRVMFFDFSCAFNTIWHALLRGKMKGVRVDEQLTAWTIDDLTNRPLSWLCVWGVTVLSPFVVYQCTSLYLSDFRYNLGHCQKCSQMIRPSSDAHQVGTTKDTGGSSTALSTGPTLSKLTAARQRKCLCTSGRSHSLPHPWASREKTLKHWTLTSTWVFT